MIVGHFGVVVRKVGRAPVLFVVQNCYNICCLKLHGSFSTSFDLQGYIPSRRKVHELLINGQC